MPKKVAPKGGKKGGKKFNKKKSKKGGKKGKKDDEKQKSGSLKVRHQAALKLLGISNAGDSAPTGEIEEKVGRGNWFYESVRKIIINVMYKVQPFHQLYPYTGYIEKVKAAMSCKPTLEAMMLDDYETKKLHEVFRSIDEDDSGSLSIKEFFTFFQFTYVSPLAVRYFGIFDEDKSGELSFCEFAVAAWNFCANCDKIGMINFAFDAYDDDKSGHIDAQEATTLLVEAFGDRKRMNEHCTRLLGQLERMKDLDIQMPKGAFTLFVRKHESIFFPIFTLQREMRRHICGMEFWERIRLNMCKKLNLGNRKAANFDLAHCRKAIKLSLSVQIDSMMNAQNNADVVPESPVGGSKYRTSYDAVHVCFSLSLSLSLSV